MHAMKLSRERLLLLSLFAAVVVVWGMALAGSSGYLTITVLDVGQGDSLLIQAPNGRTVLVDGGGRVGEDTRGYDVGREVVLPALLARRVGKLDALVITHPHEDHLGGLNAVVEQVPVGMVLDPVLDEQSPVYQELRQLLQAKRIPVRRATEGQRLNLQPGLSLEVLNPPDPRLSGTGADTNNNSVVMRLRYDGFSLLLAGDIEQRGAERVARLGPAVECTALKVPHHGSAGAAETDLIETVKPALAVVSVGRNNSFGHPTPEALEELKRVGATVMRTDEDGAVTIRVRPPRWWAKGSIGGSRAARAAGVVKEGT
jgi:competence protein ComEC